MLQTHLTKVAFGNLARAHTHKNTKSQTLLQEGFSFNNTILPPHGFFPINTIRFMSVYYLRNMQSFSYEISYPAVVCLFSFHCPAPYFHAHTSIISLALTSLQIELGTALLLSVYEAKIMIQLDFILTKRILLHCAVRMRKLLTLSASKLSYSFSLTAAPAHVPKMVTSHEQFHFQMGFLSDSSALLLFKNKQTKPQAQTPTPPTPPSALT